mgnify:FL=1|tara:strand:+ start:626 stop:790 length:165 start_codon:yes stop_codon:yes gene_type:complete
MVMLTFTVNKNNKLLKVEKSKEKGIFKRESDKKYAKKIINKLKERTNNGKRKKT